MGSEMCIRDSYYSEQLINVEDIVQANIEVFPNPASDYVFFNLPSSSLPAHIELYDAQGRLVDTQYLNNNKITVGHLNAGAYFYQLSHDGQQYGGKLVIR